MITWNLCLNRGLIGEFWNMAYLRNFIEFCFMTGLRHGEILQLLTTVDGIIIRMHALRLILKAWWDCTVFSWRVLEGFMDTGCCPIFTASKLGMLWPKWSCYNLLSLTLQRDTYNFIWYRTFFCFSSMGATSFHIVNM